MIDARFKPLTRWIGTPTKDWSRRDAAFRSTYAQTLDLLEDELNKLRAKNIIIEAGFEARDIRNDGWPRSSARPKQAGVIISFTRGTQEVAMPCDTFKSWEDNIRAIALSLKALRDVDRYGVTKSGEQYKGFAQLEAPEGEISIEMAARILASHSHPAYGYAQIRDNKHCFEQAYKRAAKASHPDAGGNHEAFCKVQQAKSVLETIHGRI